MALFDMELLTDHLRGNEQAKEILLMFREGFNYCSVLTSGEVLFSMRDKEREKTLTLLNNLQELSVDREIIRLAYKIKMGPRGAGLKFYDCIVAATAMKFKQMLVTRNGRYGREKKEMSNLNNFHLCSVNKEDFLPQ